MAPIWTQRINLSVTDSNKSVILTPLLSKPIIVCSITSTLQQETWFRSGYLAQMKSIPTLNLLAEVEKDYRLGFRPRLLKFPLAFGEKYQLRFSPMPWLTTYRIIVHEYSEEF